MLGPLEVVSHGRQVPLRGVQQRAVLGYLSLHANSAVATSDLIKALWRPVIPSTARKMLHNAVAGVRATLAGTQASLLTHAPGYLLRVPPDAIDLWHFHRQAETGRRYLLAGDLPAAAATLHRALGLWRGRILADLTECGIDWPELTAAHSTRLAVLEDYADAQVTMGNYQEVIERLEPVAAEEGAPPRERLAAQLMIALYRSGRQADALGVYRRTRAALVEQTGLDPSRALQDLERAMLEHDPMLTAPPRGSLPEAAATGAAAWPVSAARPPAPPVAAQPAQEPVDGPAGKAITSELKPVTVLLLRAGISDPAQEHDPEEVRAALRDLHVTVTEIVARHRGVVRREAVGSLWTVWFGVPQTGDDDVERAIRAARELRRECHAKGRRRGLRLAVQLAVASGEALVRWVGSPQEQTEVAGGVLDSALALLTEVGPGGLRLCDTTRRLAGWVLSSPAQDPALRQGPMIERDREMRLLRRMLEDVTVEQRPHVLTVLGEPGIGKSRLAAEFLSYVGGQAHRVVVKGPGRERESSVAAWWEVNLALSAALETPLPHDGTEAGMALANRHAIERLAAQKPVVLVLEDLHRADESVLRHVQELIAAAAGLPVLVLALARPELDERRRRWREGGGVDTTIKLEPLSDRGMRRLLHAVAGGGGDAPALVDDVVSRVRGNPRLAVEYARHLDEVVAGEPTPPAAVQRLIAAQLDRLPAVQKATIQDAAVLGGMVSASALAAVSGRSPEEVRQQLRVLEAQVLIRRANAADGSSERYEFWNPLVRDVAYAQLPRCVRASKHYRAATWLSGRGEGEFAEYHSRQVAPLTMTLGECEEMPL